MYQTKRRVNVHIIDVIFIQKIKKFEQQILRNKKSR